MRDACIIVLEKFARPSPDVTSSINLVLRSIAPMIMLARPHRCAVPSMSFFSAFKFLYLKLFRVLSSFFGIDVFLRIPAYIGFRHARSHIFKVRAQTPALTNVVSRVKSV